MKIAIAASLLASATAFAPVARKSSSTSLSMGFENELGAQAPLGFFVSPSPAPFYLILSLFIVTLNLTYHV